ncbi:MAG: hypothetical protein SOY17_03535, partial [Evtepia sp.]|nr:hypothetical protein [Evtepia sp.]
AFKSLSVMIDLLNRAMVENKIFCQKGIGSSTRARDRPCSYAVNGPHAFFRGNDRRFAVDAVAFKKGIRII